VGQDGQQRIWEKNWARAAEEARRATAELVVRAVAADTFRFLTRAETDDFGQRFSKRLAKVDHEYEVGFEMAVRVLRATQPPAGEVIWFHSRTPDTGAIAIVAAGFWPNVALLRDRLGPDLIFADQELEIGFSFEEQENDSFLRFWGDRWREAAASLDLPGY
jgi:hypothetical protein